MLHVRRQPLDNSTDDGANPQCDEMTRASRGDAVVVNAFDLYKNVLSFKCDAVARNHVGREEPNTR